MKNKENIAGRYKVIILILAIFVAYICRMLDTKNSIFKLAGYLRTYIYITIFYLWGRSVKRRIIQKQVQRYLMCIASLMIFWIMIRTAKYFMVDSINVSRYLWYMYYIPLLAIPLSGLLVAMSLGKEEEYKLPKWTGILYMPTVASILFVLTNDFHQKMFAFPDDGSVWSDSKYSYASGYGVVMIWCIGCAISAIVIIVIKSRVPNTRKIMWRPILPLVILFIYMGLYISEINGLRIVLGDMTVFCCLFFTAIFESCIQCGLIQSNSEYDELFHVSTLGARIVDNEGNEYYKSYNGNNVDLTEILNKDEIITDSGIRYSKASIKGGYVIWQENIKKLLELRNISARNKAELESNKKALQDGYYVNKRLKELTEHNRLYSIAHSQVKSQLDKLSALINEYSNVIFENNEQSEDLQTQLSEESGNILSIGKIANENYINRIPRQMMVLGAYVKRRCNLLLLADKNDNIPAKELELCFRESARNLSLYGLECSISYRLQGEIPAIVSGQLYDIFEEIVEKNLNSLETITVWIDKIDIKFIMNITLESNIKRLAVNEFQHYDKELCEMKVEKDDDMWIIKTIMTGGEVL